MPQYLSIFLVAVLVLPGCGKGPNASTKGSAAPTAPLIVSAEDLVTVRNSALASGPAITGSIQPERRADLRAEVPAVVIRALKENGDPVKKGDLLVQLDDTASVSRSASSSA